MSKWETIDTEDGRLHEISSVGTYRVDGQARRQHKTSKGYMKVSVGSRTVSVHRLVAVAFIPNPEHLREVNHIDGNKANNNVENLEWVTRSQNMKHAYANGLHPGVALHGEDNPNFGRRGARHSQSMAVRAVFPDGRTRDYESQNLAAQDGFEPSKISLCVSGKRKTHGGAIWQPLPEPPEGKEQRRR
jgi:hypothetical protein